jgi:hypothetical protein
MYQVSIKATAAQKTQERAVHGRDKPSNDMQNTLNTFSFDFCISEKR